MLASELKGDARLPRYQRVADLLRQQVIEGVLQPGDQVPSENALARDFDIAPGTARQAVAELVSEGLLERLHGKGTYVRRPNFDRSLFRFFRFVGAGGARVIPDSRILSIRTKTASTLIAKHLQLAPGSSVISIQRLRLIAKSPVLLEEISVPADRFKPLLKLSPNAFGPLLYPVYEALCGATVAKASEELAIESASIKTAKALQIDNAAPVVVIDRLARGFDGTPLEWRRSRGRADQFHYSIELT